MFVKIRCRLTAKYLIDVSVVAIIALMLRIINLEGYPTWALDEGYYVQLGWNIFHGFWGDREWFPHFFPPLYPVLIGLLEVIFGKSYFVARMLGAILGTVSVVLTYMIGTKIYNRFVGLSAALLLSVAGLFINRMVVMDNGVELFFLLTIFSYLKCRENKKSNWVYLTGIFSGLAFLSKYQGIVAMMFLVIQSIIDKRSDVIKKSILVFFALSLIYPIIGGIQNWGTFFYDMFYQALARQTIVGGANTVDEALAILMFGLFEGKWLYPPYVFTLLGFLSLFYIAARNDEDDKPISVAILSLLLTIVIVRLIWWVILIIIIPFFSIAIAVVINDIVNQKKNWMLSTILVSIISVPMFVETVDFQSSYQQTIIIMICFIIFLIIIHDYLKARHDSFSKHHENEEHILNKSRRRIVNIILVSTFIIIFLGNSFHDIEPIGQNQNIDRYMVAEFLNKNTSENDLVAVEPRLLPLINAFGVNYQHVLLNTTHEDLYLYPKETLSRFSTDVSIQNIKYIVLGEHWFNFEGGQTKGTVDVTNMILTTWMLAYGYGEYTVYLNPRFALEKSKRIIDDSFLAGWHFAYEKGTKDNGFNTAGDIGSLTTTTTEIRGYAFWYRNFNNVSLTEYPYFVLRYKVNNPNMRVVVKFLDSTGKEIGESEEDPQGSWFKERNPSTSFKTVLYKLSDLSHEFSNATIGGIIVGMDSFERAGYTYVLDIDFVGFIGK